MAIYGDDDVGKFNQSEKVLNDFWCVKIEYIISFTEQIYEMLRITNNDERSLHLVYGMWDTVERVKGAIY